MLSGLFLLLGQILFFTGYVKQDDSFPMPLTVDEEKELLEKMWQGNSQAREKLVEHNMRLVAHIAKKYTNYSDSEELISIGSIGLIKAVNTFSNDKGTRFATYGARCIENEILMTMRSNKKIKNTRSLYEPVSKDKDGNEMCLIDVLCDEDENTFEKIEGSILKERLMYIIQQILSEKEREIVKLRYGLVDEVCYTQKEISKQFHISRSYVSRIESSAIKKIRDYLQENNIEFW